MKTTFPPHGRALLHQTPAGAVVIVENGTAVTHLFFSRMAQPEHLEWEETPLLRQTADQLDEYFQGSRRVFDVPLSPQGTEFEQQGSATPFTLFTDVERMPGNTPASP